MTDNLQQHVEWLSRERKVALWTVGQLQRLETSGLITLDIRLEPQGAELFEALLRSGYEPPEQDLRIALRALALKSTGQEPDAGLVDDIVVLIKGQKGAGQK